MSNKYIYVSIFILLSLFFLYYKQIPELSKESFTGKKIKIKSGLKKKKVVISNINDQVSKNKNDIRELTHIIRDYKKKIIELELSLKLKDEMTETFIDLGKIKDSAKGKIGKGLDNIKNKLPIKVQDPLKNVSYSELSNLTGSELSAGKQNIMNKANELKNKQNNIIRNTISNLFGNTEEEINPISEDIRISPEILNKTNSKTYKQSEELSSSINLAGKKSLTYAEERSYHPNQEESIIFNEEVNEHKKVWDHLDRNRIYHYIDNQDREIYRVYQPGNMLVMKENDEFKILSENRLQLCGNYENRIILDKDIGIHTQTNQEINMENIDKSNTHKGKFNITHNSTKVIHTNKIIIKVGENVVLVDKDSITISGDKVNILGSESISLTTDKLNIDANKTVINSDIDILGKTSQYGDYNLFGKFIHRGNVFSSFITDLLPVDKLQMMNSVMNQVKRDNLNNINKFQKFKGYDIFSEQDIQQSQLHLANHEKEFSEKLKEKLNSIVDLLDLQKYKDDILENSETDSEFQDQSLNSSMMITPGKFNLNVNKSGKEGVIDLLTNITNYTQDEVSSSIDSTISEIDTSEAFEKVQNKTQSKILNNAGLKPKQFLESFIDGPNMTNTLKNKLNSGPSKYLNPTVEEEIILQNKRLKHNVDIGIKNLTRDNLQKWIQNQDDKYLTTIFNSFQNILEALQKYPNVSSISLDSNVVSLGYGSRSMLSCNRDKFNIITDNLHIKNNNFVLDSDNIYQKSLLHNVQSNKYNLSGIDQDIKFKNTTWMNKDIRIKSRKTLFDFQLFNLFGDNLNIENKETYVTSPIIKISNKELNFNNKFTKLCIERLVLFTRSYNGIEKFIDKKPSEEEEKDNIGSYLEINPELLNFTTYGRPGISSGLGSTFKIEPHQVEATSKLFTFSTNSNLESFVDKQNGSNEEQVQLGSTLIIDPSLYKFTTYGENESFVNNSNELTGTSYSITPNDVQLESKSFQFSTNQISSLESFANNDNNEGGVTNITINSNNVNMETTEMNCLLNEKLTLYAGSQVESFIDDKKEAAPEGTLVEITKDKLNLSGPLQEFTGGEASITRFTGAVEILGETSQIGDITIEGESKIEGATKQTGEVNFQGDVKVTGKLTAGSLECPSANLPNITGNITNADLAKQAVKADLATQATNAANANFATNAGMSMSTNPAFMPSDRRLKTNIKFLRYYKDSIPIYSFNYIWDSNNSYIGTIAQELLGTKWKSAVKKEDGFYMVNYNLL